MVRKALADGYDGIALNIIDAQAFNEVVAEAASKGVPVVAFNVDAAPSSGPRVNARLAGVCQNFLNAGRTLGTKALEFIPPGSKVLITKHDTASPPWTTGPAASRKPWGPRISPGR